MWKYALMGALAILLILPGSLVLMSCWWITRQLFSYLFNSEEKQ